MISQSYQICKSHCIFHSLTSHQTMTSYDYDYVNFIVSALNSAIKINSKETDYTVNYWIDYTNVREKPIEVAISLLWNASIHLIFLSRMKVSYIDCTEKCIDRNGVCAKKI